MANHFSALKRTRQTLKRTEENKATRTRLRHAIREFRRAVASGDPGNAQSALPKVVSTIDKSLKKGAIKANTANRFKSRLTARLTGMNKPA